MNYLRQEENGLFYIEWTISLLAMFTDITWTIEQVITHVTRNIWTIEQVITHVTRNIFAKDDIEFRELRMRDFGISQLRSRILASNNHALLVHLTNIKLNPKPLNDIFPGIESLSKRYSKGWVTRPIDESRFFIRSQIQLGVI